VDKSEHVGGYRGSGDRTQVTPPRTGSASAGQTVGYVDVFDKVSKLEALVERQASQLESLADKYHELKDQHDDLVDKLTRVVNVLISQQGH
jgi:hypothetical protein